METRHGTVRDDELQRRGANLAARGVMNAGAIEQSLQDIDDQLQHGYIEEPLLDLRDLAVKLGAIGIIEGARNLLASWRNVSRLDRTAEQKRVDFGHHSDEAFKLLDDLQERIHTVDVEEPAPAEVTVPPAAPVALAVKDLAKQYKRAFRLAGVTFELQPGQVLGIVGPNGSGKTTLLRILAGELAHDLGDVLLDGEAPGDRGYLTRVAYVPQRPEPWSHSMETHLQWQAALAGATSMEVNRTQVADVLAWLGLGPHREKRFGELSEGQRMRVAIAVAILSNPRLLILDEPLAPLDPFSQLTLLGWLRRRTRKWRDVLTILSSQHVPEVEFIADQILYLNDGHVVSVDARAADRGLAYEIAPSDDQDGFRSLESILKSLVTSGSISELIACERYAFVAILHAPVPFHLFAEQISRARPRMLRDVSSSARRLLLTREHSA